jgi:(p)ppGpp synthase/HD superfamily hydrolase
MSDAVRLVALAADFAALRHADQRRKGARRAPYVNHLAEVALLVAETPAGSDGRLVAAAFLHDVVEDGHATADEVGNLFGDDIRALVEELTDDMSLPEEERKRRQVEEIPGKSAEARLLKLADKLSNVREIASDPPLDWPRDKRRRYAEWAVAVVDAGCRGLDATLEQAFDRAAAEVLAKNS